jgi:hypothetical protein
VPRLHHGGSQLYRGLFGELRSAFLAARPLAHRRGVGRGRTHDTRTRIPRLRAICASCPVTHTLSDTPKEGLQDMRTDREIRAQIIGHLTNVYTNTPDLEGEAEDQPLWDDPDPEWTSEEIAAAYAIGIGMGMFIYYAREVEAQGGPSFLEHLQRQATVNALDDEPPATS